MTKTFTWISDPGHAWLLVSLADLHALGLHEADFSQYSYRLSNRVALEEDLDAGIFLDAYRRKYGAMPTFREQVEAHRDSIVRSWTRYGCKP